MNTTKFKGNPVQLSGHIPEIGAIAPDFTYVRGDLSEKSLSDHGDRVKIIIAVPSLDTGVCQTETKRFSKELSSRKEAVGIVVSKDLPFAMKRFCATEGIENIENASDFRGNFTERYKTAMADGKMKGLSARVVFVLDGNNEVKFVEMVDDITHEPNYDAALEVVDNLLLVVQTN